MDRLGTDQQRGAMTDWIAWHERYRDPDSSLARRLGVVQRRIAETLVKLAPLTDRRVLSLCSGDGRDLIGVLDGLAAGPEPRSRLVAQATLRRSLAAVPLPARLFTFVR